MNELTYLVSRLETSKETFKDLMEYQKSKERDEVYTWEIANLELLIEDLYKKVSGDSNKINTS